MISLPSKTKIKKWLITAVVILAALSGSVIAVWQFGGVNVQVKGLLLKVQLVPSLRSETILDIPPFGEVVADTHRGVFSLKVTLERVETETITSDLEKTSSVSKYFDDLKNDFSAQVELFFLRQFVMALIGALAAIWLLLRLRSWRLVKYTAAGSLIFAVVLGISFYRYDFNAFNEPEYRGTLKMAPKALEIANQTLSDLDKLKGQANVVVGNIKQLFDSTNGLPGLNQPDGQDGSVAVLIVSDLHTNPVGVEFMKAIAQQFRVDMVIDAGDLSDMGSMPEASLITDIAGLGMPQVFVSGNHDTQAIMDKFAAAAHIQIASGKQLEVKGLKILGWPDPLGSSDAVEYADSDTKKAALKAETQAIADAVEQQGTPDILVVHNQSVAIKSAALAPLVVTGHTHRIKLLSNNGHVLINPGTVGAAGFRGLYSESDAGYSAAIVYIKPGGVPQTCDMIRYKPDSGQFFLERQVLADKGSSLADDKRSVNN